jgi:hypothetical protein
MKRLLLVVGLVFAFSWACIAQTSAAATPATKADVEKYLQIVQSHDMVKKMAASMARSMHQVIHEQYLKHKDSLPADYESKETAEVDNEFENMPWDEMVQAMVPAYQKHLSKGDIDGLIAFYSSPIGQKLLREMPAIMAEGMQNAAPIMTKYNDTVQQTLLRETDVMIAESKKQSGAKAPTTHN